MKKILFLFLVVSLYGQTSPVYNWSGTDLSVNFAGQAKRSGAKKDRPSALEGMEALRPL